MYNNYYFIKEVETNKGFTISKIGRDNKLLGRLRYENSRIWIANATLCKTNRFSNDVTPLKLNNFFGDIDYSFFKDCITFENKYYNDLIEYALYQYDAKGYCFNFNSHVVRMKMMRECFSSTPIEILLKSGFKQALMDSNTSPLDLPNKQGTTPREILDMSKIGLKIFKEVGVRTSSLRKTTQENSDFLAKYYPYLKKYMHGKEEMQHMLSPYTIDRIKILAKQYHYNLDRLVEYIGVEIRFTQGIDDPIYGINILFDYAKMNKDMNIKKFEKYPKSLKMAHDIIALRYNIKIKEEQEECFKNIREHKLFLEFETNDFKFILPKNLEDIKQEGQLLSHCVASYCKDVAKGKTNIIFMRDINNPQKRLVTIEVSNDNFIVQARGRGNRHLRKNESDSLVLYKSYLSKTNNDSNYNV